MRTINATDGHKAVGIRYEEFGQFQKAEVQDAVMQNELIVFQRNLFCEPYFSAVEYFQGLGKPVILDLDDAYPILPWSNPAHAFWIENAREMNPVPLEGLANGVRLVDAVSSPSKMICQDWVKENSRTVWIPNFAQGKWYGDLPGKPDELKDRVVIGWGGSVSHYDSFWLSGVRSALERVCQRHPEVLFKHCGNDARIWAQLPIHVGQKTWQLGVPPSEWPKIISTFDIGIAPLDTLHPYDSRRSWIKGVEYMLAKVPWVGSDAPPYMDIRQYGHMVENTVEAWEQALEHMITNLDDEKEKAAGVPYQKGLELTMENNVGFYAQLVEKMKVLRNPSHSLPGIMHIRDDRMMRQPVVLEDVLHVGPE